MMKTKERCTRKNLLDIDYADVLLFDMVERRPNKTDNENRLQKEQMPKALFELGNVYVTVGAQISIKVANLNPVQLLSRHVTGDWGNLPDEDIKENKRSLEQGFRIFSAYDLETGGRIYAITEWDRSVTTLLTPDEY